MHNLIFNNGCLTTSSKIPETLTISWLEPGPTHCCYHNTLFFRKGNWGSRRWSDRGRSRTPSKGCVILGRGPCNDPISFIPFLSRGHGWPSQHWVTSAKPLLSLVSVRESGSGRALPGRQHTNPPPRFTAWNLRPGKGKCQPSDRAGQRVLRPRLGYRREETAAHKPAVWSFLGGGRQHC